MFKKIHAILQVEDVKQLMKNFFSLSVLKLANAVLPFVTLPYLIKVLGLQQYGAIVLALSLIAYFQSITNYGFNLSATREIARHKNSRKQLSFIYSKTQTSKVYLLLFSLSILVPMTIVVPQFKEDLLVYLLMCLMLVGQSMFPEWFFRGIEKMGYITILDLIVKGSFTIGVFILIKSPEDYWLYPLLYGLGYIFIAIFSHFFIIKKFKINSNLVKFRKVRKTLRAGFPLFVNQFLPNLFNNTTNFLVGIILGKSAAGLFGATRQVIQLLTVLNSVVSGVVFPYLIRNKDKFLYFSRFYLGTITIASILLAVLHQYIFNIIGINYDNDTKVFYILLLGFLSIVVYSVYSTNYLISRGYDKIVMKLSLYISLLGFVLAFPLIKFFGLLGSAFNIFICQFFLGAGAYYYYRSIELSKYNAN